jgi:3-isopropylmalate/(R)-2-methylmalate dehydratase small subunit
MIPAVRGRVHRLGDNVDTDQIIPGRYLSLQDPALLAPHALEGCDPSLAARIRPGDILVGGRNFGCGSSREHAPLALLAAGIRAVVVASVARIFHRNSVNLALPVIICPEAARALAAGEEAGIDFAAGEIRQGASCWSIPKLEGEVAAIMAAGGLVPWARAALAAG